MNSKRDIRTIATLLIGLALAIGLSGCGPTNQEAIEQFKPQYAEMRADLEAIAAALPASVAEQQVAQALDPAPFYMEDSPDDIHNTDILMYASLVDPDLDLRDAGQLDLRLSNYLRRNLQWTGPNNPMSETSLKNRAADNFPDKLEQGLQIKYLGVARVGAYERAVAVSEDTFDGGYAEIDGFLVDMESKDVLCAFTISARPSEQVSYTYKEGESQLDALERFANSTLWSNAREAFIDKLDQNCSGMFRLRD